MEMSVHFQTEQLILFFNELLFLSFHLNQELFCLKRGEPTDTGSCEESQEVEDCRNSNWKKNILNIIPIKVWHRIA